MAASLDTIVEGSASSEWYSVHFADNFDDRAGHTVYNIKVFAPNGESWMIQKRYSEVRELHDSLRLWLRDGMPPIPGRRLFGNHDPLFIMERQAGLERYLNGTLRIVGSHQLGLLQCLVAQFLGGEVPIDVQRGRTFSASFTSGGRDDRLSYSGRKDTSAPPGHRCNQHFVSQLRAASADGSLHQMVPRTQINISHSQPPANLQQNAAPVASSTRCLSRSVTPESCSDAPLPQRQRRWSRRHYNRTQGETICAEDSRDDQKTSLPETPEIVSNVADDKSARREDNKSKESRSSPHAQVCQRQQHEAASQGSVGVDAGKSWDWPLSRDEKQERVRLIDRRVNSLDREALLGEIEQLRTSFSGAYLH